MTTFRTRSEQQALETVRINRQQQMVLDNTLTKHLELLSLNNDLDELTKMSLQFNLLKEHREATAKLNGLLF